MLQNMLTPWRWPTRNDLNFIDSALMQKLIGALIVMNGITLALETWKSFTLLPMPYVDLTWGEYLQAIDKIFITLFVLEIFTRMLYRGWAFFRDPVCWFDTLVTLVPIIPLLVGSGDWGFLTALRAFRLIRLATVFPGLRTVVEDIVRSMPAMGDIGVLTTLWLLVFGIVGTKLFGGEHPEAFGSIGLSLYSLTKAGLFEGWDVIDATVSTHGWGAAVFMLAFVPITGLLFINLVLGALLNAMATRTAAETERKLHDEVAELKDRLDAVLALLKAQKQ